MRALTSSMSLLRMRPGMRRFSAISSAAAATVLTLRSWKTGRTLLVKVGWPEGRTVSSTVVFVHGSGRTGADNWPNQLEQFADAAFLTMPGYGDETPVLTNIDDWVERTLSVAGELHLVAH